MQKNKVSMRIGILFIILPWLLSGCKKESTTPPAPEVIDYGNLNGIIAFSRSEGRIMILDGAKILPILH